MFKWSRQIGCRVQNEIETPFAFWFSPAQRRRRERKRRKRIDNRTNRNVVRTNLQQSAMILCPYNIGNFIKTVFEQTLKGNIWLLFTSGASNEQIPFEQANIVPLYSCVVPNYLPTYLPRRDLLLSRHDWTKVFEILAHVFRATSETMD